MSLTKERLESALSDIVNMPAEIGQEALKRAAMFFNTHQTTLKLALQTLIDAKTAPTWQPIETAPKDVLVDLLWEGKRFVDCNWDHICQEWRHMTHFNQLIFIKKPEYWMPTPPEKSE